MDSKTFKKILFRNLALPLILSVILCTVFVILLFNVLDASRAGAKSNLVLEKTERVQNLIVDSETGLRGYLITGREGYLEPRQEANRHIDLELTELRALLAWNPVEVEHLSRLTDLYREWDHFAQETIELRKQNKYRFGADSDLRKDKMDQIRAEFDAIIAAESQIRDRRIENTAATARTVVFVTVILSLIFGVLLAALSNRQLRTLSNSYGTALETQRQQNEILSRQAWLRSAQAELSTRLRGDFSAKEMAARLLKYVTEFLGAALGAVYGVSEDGTVARLAGYGWSDGKEAHDPHGAETPRLYRPGEGLVGRAALEQKPVLIENLPDDYDARIASDLGSARPRRLLLSSLAAGGTIQGVIELAFVDKMEERAIEFLESTSELVGVAMKSAAYRDRLQYLLEQAQQMTEELQTQQEELRVSNEELSERSRALQEAQTRLESQHAELEQTNEQLEEQAQTLENQRNSLDEQNRALESARDAIEEKARELEAASRYKSEFLANMSHELRTPLNSSLILAKLLMDNSEGNLTSEQVEFASTIYSAGNDLLNLINDILDLSKVEAGRLELKPEKVSIVRLLDSLGKTFAPLANEKHLELVLERTPGAPDTLETDRQRIEQVLKNLIANAIKFTEAGSVRVEVEPRPEGRVAFSVKDTGVGIDPSQHDLIFEAFKQADGTSSRKYGGTGLGLSISRNLALLLGGSIELESEPGKGSVFSLVLPTQYVAPSQGAQSIPIPLSQAAAPMSHPTPGPERVPARKDILAPAREPRRAPSFEDDRASISSPGGRTLLVVEDEPHFAKILFDLAHEVDFRCLVAETTAEGYELATRYLPSAVILDMKLPDALGLSLLDRLKDNPKTRHIPVHAISVADYSREALQLGAVGYVRKPADREELKKTFRKLEEKISQQIRRVLVVEDDAAQRTAIEKLIGEKGVEIVSTGRGREALEKLKAGIFDCMVMDLTLPDISGFELLETLAEQDGLSFPPVIVYTGRELTTAEEERLRRYSQTIIIKGARSPERLLDEVTLFLHSVESSLSPERRQMLRRSRSRERAFDGRRILLVDDDVRNIFALTSVLEHKGAKVVIARNGREALDRLEEAPDASIVLMDIMMPGMDGYEAIRRIRKQARFASLPIIAVTAKAMRDDYEKCLEAGANDYLAKPIDVDRLVSLMRVWLPKEL